ncbi:MAG: (2Fe-2S)-binding protein [Limnobacter sp.]|nr:(2Fe-2S)-binding protein [Limnobacter sp.]
MIKLQINGQEKALDSTPDTPLLWALRDELSMTGTKFGCGMALCGACTVHVDGVATRSCVTPIEAVQGKAITTIEGAQDKFAEAVKKAWVSLDVAQCGYCQPGQVMAASALLKANPKPTDAQVDEALSGNVCRCGSYPRIRQAVHEAAKALGA